MLQLSRLLFQGYLSAVEETEVNCLLVERSSLNYDNSHNRTERKSPSYAYGISSFQKVIFRTMWKQLPACWLTSGRLAFTQLTMLIKTYCEFLRPGQIHFFSGT